MQNLSVRQKFAGVIAAILALFGVTTSAVHFGSVTIGNEMLATTTNTVALFRNDTVLTGKSGATAKGTPTVLGSVIITTTGTSPMCLYDGTSTATNAEWATTTIACFPASATVGTYTFDAQYKKGILIDFTGSPTTSTYASSTFTYR